MLERWERRAHKLRKRRDGMRVSGAGLKKVHLPLIDRKSEEAQKRATRKKGSPASAISRVLWWEDIGERLYFTGISHTRLGRHWRTKNAILGSTGPGADRDVRPYVVADLRVGQGGGAGSAHAFSEE